MTQVLYSSPYIPAEWIAAHGLCPSRSAPSGATRMFASGAAVGMCPFAAAFSEMALQSADPLVVMTTACDQMRRASEIVAQSMPVFLMHVPATADTPEAFGLYREELLRLGRFLVMHGGHAPSAQHLADTLDRYDAARAALRAAWSAQSGLTRARALAAFHRDGPAVPELDEAPAPEGPAVALVGGPLMAEDIEPGGFLDIVERAGAHVALDATTSGERGEPGPYDRRRMRDDPVGELVDAYFGRIPDAFMRPNAGLYRWLKEALETRAIKGIVFRRYMWCDTWHGEALRMKEWAGLPVLIVEVADGGCDADRVRARVEAFVEMLQ